VRFGGQLRLLRKKCRVCGRPLPRRSSGEVHAECEASYFNLTHGMQPIPPKPTASGD